MDAEKVVGTTLPHSSFGKQDCCGCLNAIICGELAEIVCNECEAVTCTVPAAEVEKTLAEMELSLDVSAALCPLCDTANLFPGFSKVFKFICRECGEAVDLRDGRG